VTASDVLQLLHAPETPAPIGKPVTTGFALPVFWSFGSIQSAQDEPEVLELEADEVTRPEVLPELRIVVDPEVLEPTEVVVPLPK